MFRVSNKLKTFFVNSSLVTIQGKLDIVTASFWSNLRHIYSQISQLWVSTKGLGGWPTSDFVSLQFINTLASSKHRMRISGNGNNSLSRVKFVSYHVCELRGNFCSNFETSGSVCSSFFHEQNEILN